MTDRSNSSHSRFSNSKIPGVKYLLLWRFKDYLLFVYSRDVVSVLFHQTLKIGEQNWVNIGLSVFVDFQEKNKVYSFSTGFFGRQHENTWRKK